MKNLSNNDNKICREMEENNMTNIKELLNPTLKEEFIFYYNREISTITLQNKIVREKLAELNATNTLLIKIEGELRALKTKHEYKMLNLRNSAEYMTAYKTLKQREEQSKIETDEYTEKINNLKDTQSILKCNQAGLIYELDTLLLEGA